LRAADLRLDVPDSMSLPDDAAPMCIPFADVSEYKQVSNVGWTLEESSKAFVADSQGAELTLQFHVVDKKVRMFISYLKTHLCEPKCPGTASFSIDDGLPTEVNAFSQDIKMADSVMVDLGEYPQGDHTITLKFTGDDSQNFKAGMLMGHKTE